LSSTLSNPDLAPTAPGQRTWSKWNLAALWIGMSVCIPTYTLAASMIDGGMSWVQAVMTVMLGNLIVLVPMILIGHAGTKYGVPFPVLVRASFGTSGAHIAAIARALVACGWFGIQTWIGGKAIYQIFGALEWIDIAADTRPLAMLGITPMQLLCFLAFWAINLLVVLLGINCIKWLETWAAPFLLLMGLALLGWAVASVESLGDLFSQASSFESSGQFWATFFPQLTAMVAFWATLSLNIPDFTRYCRSQTDQALGQLIGLPATMTLFCFIGVIVTAATVLIFGEAIWDPVELVPRLGSRGVVVLALVALTVATLSTNIAANVVSPANGFSNVWPRRIGFRTGGLITCLIGVAIQPWYLYEDLSAYIFTWLIGYSGLLAPIAGIMLCDYFVLRRTRLDVAALYDRGGIYGGTNPRAIIALILAVLPNVPGFINATSGNPIFPAFFDHLYSNAWFVGISLGMILYYLLMRGRAVPASTPGQPPTDPLAGRATGGGP
jgi:NCS1 family nucleobase:cation symporter-1